MRPAISVLVPARDAARTIDRTLASIARQSFRDFECVVVDDGSRDATASVVRHWMQQDARFRCVKGTGEGLVSALNLGLSSCRGRYVARMDADDLMARRRLELQHRALVSGTYDGVGAHVRFFPRKGLSDGLRRYERWLNGFESAEDVGREAFIECTLAHPTWMVRHDLLARLRYRDAGWPEDYDLLLRILGQGGRLGVVPERLHHWRDHSTRLSRVSSTYSTEAFTSCRAHHLANTFLASSREYLLWGYGGTGRALAAALRGHDKHPVAIIEVHPGRIGQRILGVPVLAIADLPEPDLHRMVVSVAGEGPRQEIRQALATTRWSEGNSFVFAA